MFGCARIIARSSRPICDGPSSPIDTPTCDPANFTFRLLSAVIRMTAVSNLNVKFAGSHVGVSIGEDGPSQMGLEDLAMMRAQPNMAVFYPCEDRKSVV